MSPKKLLVLLYRMDPEREGIVNTHVTYDLSGAFLPEREQALEECLALGWVTRSSHFTDITDAGLAVLKKNCPN